MSLFDDIANGFRQMFGGGNNRQQAQPKPYNPQPTATNQSSVNFDPTRSFNNVFQNNNDEEERERERKRREEEERRRQAEEARQREAERKKQEAERLRQTTQKKPGFFDYLNPFGEHGIFGAKQQQTFKQGIKPVNDVLQNYEKFIDKSDKQAGFQWNDIGDYLRFAAKLPTGMVSGVVNAPEKIGQAISGVRNNDKGEVENLNLLQRGATALDAGIDIGGLGFGGSGTLLKSLGKEVAEETAKKGIKQTIKSIAKDALQEGIEEGTQTFLGDLSDDGKLNADLNQYVQSVALGALGGGLMSGAGNSINSAKQAYLQSPQAKLDNQVAQRMATDPEFAEAVAKRKQEIKQAMLEAREEATQEQVAKKNLAQTVADAYHDGKLPIPRTELTPNAGRNARMRQAIDNAPISEPFNYGRVSKDTLAQHNGIQAQTGQDFVKNRDVTVYPNAHNAHVEKRIRHEGVSPDDYVKIAEKAIYGKDNILTAANTNPKNVTYSDLSHPSGRVIMGNFNDGLSLKSVQQINNKRLDSDIKKAQAKLGSPLVDDDSQAVSRAVSSLDSAKGMNPISNPLGTRDTSLSQSDRNINDSVKYKLNDLDPVYQKLLANPGLKQHLHDSVRARLAEDHNSKVGDTTIDSDRLISSYASRLTPEEYSRFDWDQAEDLIFNELSRLEEEHGFKPLNAQEASDVSSVEASAPTEYDLALEDLANRATDLNYLDGAEYEALYRQLEQEKAELDRRFGVGQSQPTKIDYRKRYAKEKRMLENIIAESSSIKQELEQDPTPIKQVIKQKQDGLKNVPLQNKNHAYTKGNLYEQTTLGSSEDVVRGGGAENGRRFMFGDWEMRQHTRKKNGKSFTQVERRYIDPETGEAGDWKPYSRAAYIWHTQSKKVDQANRDQLLQEALAAAKQDGEVREFVAKIDPSTGGTAVESLTGNKTIDGGLVRNPVSGEVEGNYIQVTPFGVVNQVAGKFHLTELDQIIANSSDRKPKPSIFDTYMRTVEKTAANDHSKQTQQDLYYKKTRAYAEFVKNKEEVLNEHTKQANTLESYRPTDVKAKQFWEDVGRYTENTFPAIEGKNQKEAFAQKYGEETAQAVERYSQYMRQQYDALIEQANAVRRIYGKDEIPHRKNYMPHMTKDGGLLGMVPAEIAANLRGEMETTGRGEIPANIAGLSETFKPNKKYNKHEMRRKRNDASDYELDPRKVFEKYADLVLYNAHMEPVIAEGRQLETAMRVAEHDASKEILDPLSALKQGEAKVSSRQTIAVTNFVNAMAGKSNSLDRAFIDQATEGMKLIRKLENINGANKIMGNISSTLAQALNLPSTIRDNGIVNTGKAVLNAFNPEVETAMEKSAFLTERYADGGEKFSKTKWQKFSNGVSKVTGMDLVESAFIRLAWGANYQRLKSQGIKGFELIKQTDLATERAVGGRGIGAMPQAYQSALGKIFLQFTYETNETFKNDMEHVKGIVKGLKAKDYKKAGSMAVRGAEAMVTAMMLNAIYKQVTGNEPLPDLLGATIKAGANATKDDDDETKENVVRNVVGNVGTEFIKANPIASAMVNMWPKSDRQEVFGHDSDFGRFDGATGVAQTGASLGKGMVNLMTGEKDKAVQNLAQLIPMGSQIRKTVGGADALLKGAVTKKDKNGDERVLYEVDNKNPVNIVKGLAFGKNALNETQAHYQAQDGQNTGGKIVSVNSNLLKTVEKRYGKDSVQYTGLKEAMERKKANRDNSEYKTSVQAVTDDMRIKLARGELIQDNPEAGGLLRTRDGAVAKEFYTKLAKAEGRKDVFKDYINSDEGMKFEYLEAQREYDKAMKEGSLSKKEQIKKRQELTKMQVQSDWRKEYRDAYSLTGSYQDTQGIYTLYGDAKDEVRQKLNEINDAMFKAKLITQKTYDKRYENINEINKPKRSRSGRKSVDDSFSVPKLPGYRVTGAPEFQRTTSKGKGIVKGLKLAKSSGVDVSPLPRVKITRR